MKYTLPKGYLSYSSMRLFLDNPAQFRRKYYDNIFEPTTPQIAYGKHIATLLENADDSLAHVPRYEIAEYPLEFMVEGIPIKGFIDSFDPKKKRIIEFKTGVQPWDKVRVRKHLQLTLYSLGVEILHKSVHEECKLIWLETEKIVKPQMGLIRHEDSHTIKLTGNVESFKRRIKQWERDRLREQIVEIATAISADYEAYKNRPRKSGLGLR